MSEYIKQNRIVPLDSLVPHPRNYRMHPKSQIDSLVLSLQRFGQGRSIVVQDSPEHPVIVAGHGVYEAALVLQWKELRADILPADWTDQQIEGYLIADNLHFQQASDNEELLAMLLQEQQDAGYDLAALGSDEETLRQMLEGLGDGYVAGDEQEEQSEYLTLAERFIAPPFSIFDARQGYWQERKKVWLELGLESEVGRNENLLKFSKTAEIAVGNTSIFDPVLCELIYRWFSPPDGMVLDPFAGGSVRGIVAAKLGRQYVGIDLRQEQVEANETQANVILADEDMPQWIVGDSRYLSDLYTGHPDLIFTCPPYYDLEVYSDNHDDLSNVSTYTEFLEDYRAILKQAIAQLKQDRFVCIVVGDIRDKKGFYRNFVSDTITACQDAGAKLYNEAILVTSVGSLPIRVGKQFSSGRKLGKTHQNVLIFCKGDPHKAVEACGPVIVDGPEEEEIERVEVEAHA